MWICACTACVYLYLSFILRWTQTLLACEQVQRKGCITDKGTTHLFCTANIESAVWRERIRLIQSMSYSAICRICPMTCPSSGTSSTNCMSYKLWPFGPSNRRQPSRVRASWKAGEVHTTFFFLHLHLPKL